MALPSDPSRSQIFAEFGPSTDNLITNQSLNTMYNLVFGGSVHSRTAFGGKGKASLTGLTTSVSNNVVTYQVNGLDTGGNLDTTIRLLYQSVVDGSDNELATPNSGDWIVKATITETNDGNRTYGQTFTQGTWFVAIEVYNGFISATGDWLFEYDNNDATSRVITTDGSGNDPQLTQPVINTTATQIDINTYRIQWTQGGIEPSDYDVEYEFNGGGFKSPNTTPYNETNYGSTTDPKSVYIDTDEIPFPGDTFNFRVRGTKLNYQDSIWSANASYTE